MDFGLPIKSTINNAEASTTLPNAWIKNKIRNSKGLKNMSNT